MLPKIFILTGPIQSGKTSILLQWCNGKLNVYGILTPVINGKRLFKDIASTNAFAMEVAEHEIDTLQVGRFVFSAAAFSKANELLILAHANTANTNSWLVIDEIGPLELKQQGLYKSVQKITSAPSCNTILVVREYLVEEVSKFFCITPTVIGIKEMSSLDL
jgi:nucleoside-triphosphatase THEP1